MTIDEAIEIIKTFLPPVADGLDPDEINAIQLGIEALQLLSKLRRYDIEPACEKLPGETK